MHSVRTPGIVYKGSSVLGGKVVGGLRGVPHFRIHEAQLTV